MSKDLPSSLLNADKSRYVVEVNGTTYTLLPNVSIPEGYEGPTAVLGEGDFGRVSVALQHDLTPLAAKILVRKKDDPDYQAFMDETEKEISVLKRLGRKADMKEITDTENPNQSTLLILQEFVKGESLESYMDKIWKRSREGNDEQRMEALQDLLKCMRAVMIGTKELHDKNIIHGDLHAGNILYDGENATVIDFGMSHILAPGEDHVYVEGSDQVGVYHRAPETKSASIHEGRSAEERVYYKNSDCYSIACDFYNSVLFEDPRTGFVFPTHTSDIKNDIYALIRDMAQERAVEGGNGNLHDRLSIDQSIQRVEEIQAILAKRAAQKQILDSPEVYQDIVEQFNSATTVAEAPSANNAAVKQFRDDMKTVLDYLADSGRLRTLDHDDKVAAIAALLSKDGDKIIATIGTSIGVYESADAELLVTSLSSDKPDIFNPVTHQIIEQLLSTTDSNENVTSMSNADKVQLLTEAYELAGKSNASTLSNLAPLLDKYTEGPEKKLSSTAKLGTVFGKEGLQSSPHYDQVNTKNADPTQEKEKNNTSSPADENVDDNTARQTRQRKP